MLRDSRVVTRVASLWLVAIALAGPGTSRAAHQLERTIENPTPFYLEFFGGAVARVGTSSDVLIGAPFAFDGVTWSGAVYQVDTSSGSVLRTYENPVGQTDRFGWAVTSSGNTVVVGAALANSSQTATGAVYGFDAASGSLLYTLAGVDTGDEFGTSVAPFGTELLVGAPWADVAGQLAGAAYVYDGATGTLLKTCANPFPQVGDGFGYAVASVGSTIIVGAPYVDAGQTDAGAVYLFDGGAPGSDCPLLGTLQKPGPVGQQDFFGLAVAGVAGGGVLVGAPRGHTVIPGRGAAYLFDASTGAPLAVVWSPTPGTSPDGFGWSVGALDSNLLVGALQDDAYVGAAYVFDGTSGTLLEEIANPRPAESDIFGFAVTAVGTKVLAGAPQYDDAWPTQGAAYLFALSCGNGTADAGEACDDGNTLDGDCCSSTCQVEADGSTCSDALDCTLGDTCASGLCGVCQVGTPCTGPSGESFVCQVAADRCVCAEAPPTSTTSTTTTTTSTTSTSTSTTMVTTSTTTSTLPGQQPMAFVQPSQTVRVGQVVLLDGSLSSSPNGTPLAFSWSLTDVPAGSSATLQDAQTPHPSFVPDLEGEYRVELVVNDGALDSVPALVTVTATATGAVDIVITDPGPNAVIDDEQSLVRGTVTGPLNTGVVVNGVVAIVHDGEFIANDVRLSEGATVLTATATTIDDDTATAAQLVTTSGAVQPLRLTAAPGGGVAPILIKFTYVFGSMDSVQSLEMDFDGDGTVDFTTTNPAAPLSFFYETPGLYVARLTVTDSTGATHDAEVAVDVTDLAVMEPLLGGLWDGLKSAVMTANVPGAVRFLAHAARSDYTALFQNHPAEMPSYMASLSAAQAFTIGFKTAEYFVTRTVGTETRVYFIQINRDEDGVWRMQGM
jgi:cysteine-rich repeat protein